MTCPSCKKALPEGAKFCEYCGVGLAPVPTAQCPSCKRDLPADAKFCKHCGASMVSNVTICPSCKKQLPDGVKFCTQCGTNIALATGTVPGTHLVEIHKTEEIPVVVPKSDPHSGSGSGSGSGLRSTFKTKSDGSASPGSESLIHSGIMQTGGDL